MKTILLDTSIDYTSWDINEAGSVEMTEWQPIETAPKDVAILICACETGMLVFGQRIAVAKFHTEHDLDHGKVLDFVTDDEGVRIGGRRHVRFATHWMPLPPAPKKGDE